MQCCDFFLNKSHPESCYDETKSDLAHSSTNASQQTAVRAIVYSLYHQKACYYISLQRTEGTLPLRKLCFPYLCLV